MFNYIGFIRKDNEFEKLIAITKNMKICGDFKEKYGSVKVFRRKFYSHLTEREINIEQISIKIQIRFDKSLMIY